MYSIYYYFINQNMIFLLYFVLNIVVISILNSLHCTKLYIDKFLQISHQGIKGILFNFFIILISYEMIYFRLKTSIKSLLHIKFLLFKVKNVVSNFLLIKLQTYFKWDLLNYLLKANKIFIHKSILVHFIILIILR